MKTQTPQKALVSKIEQILHEEEITNESIYKLLENTAMLQQKLTYCIHLLLNPYFQPHNDLLIFNPINNPQPFNTSDQSQITNFWSTKNTSKTPRVKRFLGPMNMILMSTLQGILTMCFGSFYTSRNNQYPSFPPAMYPQQANMISYPLQQQQFMQMNPYQLQPINRNNYDVPLTTNQLYALLNLIMRQHNPAEVHQRIDQIQTTNSPIPQPDAIANAQLLAYIANNENSILNNLQATTTTLQRNNSSLNDLISLRDKRNVNFKIQTVQPEKQAQLLFEKLIESQFPQFATLNSPSSLLFHVLNGGIGLNLTELNKSYNSINNNYTDFQLPNFDKLSDLQFFTQFITMNAQFLANETKIDKDLPPSLKLPLKFLRKMYDYLKEKSLLTKMLKGDEQNFQSNFLINLHNSFVQGNRLKHYLNNVEFESYNPDFAKWFKRLTNLFHLESHKDDIITLYSQKARQTRSNLNDRTINLQNIIANYLNKESPNAWPKLTISPLTIHSNDTSSHLITILSKIDTLQYLLIIGFTIVIVTTSIITYAMYKKKPRIKNPITKNHLEMSRIRTSPPEHTEDEIQQLTPIIRPTTQGNALHHQNTLE